MPLISAAVHLNVLKPLKLLKLLKVKFRLQHQPRPQPLVAVVGNLRAKPVLPRSSLPPQQLQKLKNERRMVGE
jgi:hypothetical protein